MKCPRFIHTAKTINSRICFSHKFNKLGIIKNNKEEIIVLPNYPVVKGKIIFQDGLPNKNQKIKIKIGNDKLIEQSLEPFEIKETDAYNDEEFLNTLNSVGQLMILKISKLGNNHLSYDIVFGTFSIVIFNKNIKILTALHNIQLNEIYLQTFIIYNFSDFDKFSHVTSLIDKLLEENLIKNSHDLNEFKENLISNLNSDDLLVEKLEEKCINPNFLNIRKEIIVGFSNEENKDNNILLDPEYYLQCLPSIDATILNISDSLSSLISKKNIKGIQIASDYESMEMNELLYAIGFNNTKGKLEIKNDYSLTLNFNNNLKEDIHLASFLNPNKSVSLVQKKFDNDYIFTNISSLSEGSSGAPIVNKAGKLIGMSIAYYQDETNYDKIDETDDLKKFDKNADAEDKLNYVKQKNSNIAISIKHKIFDIFSEFVDKKYKAKYMTKMKNYKIPERRTSNIACEEKIDKNNNLNLKSIIIKEENLLEEKEDKFTGNKRHRSGNKTKKSNSKIYNSDQKASNNSSCNKIKNLRK